MGIWLWEDGNAAFHDQFECGVKHGVFADGRKGNMGILLWQDAMTSLHVSVAFDASALLVAKMFQWPPALLPEGSYVNGPTVDAFGHSACRMLGPRSYCFGGAS